MHSLQASTASKHQEHRTQRESINDLELHIPGAQDHHAILALRARG